MSDRRLAMAALDPNQAIAAAERVPSWSPQVIAPPPVEVVRAEPGQEPVLSVEVVPRGRISRLRFLVFWLLLRLACWVYPFRFEIRADGASLPEDAA